MFLPQYRHRNIQISLKAPQHRNRHKHDACTDTTTHSHSLSISTVAECWNITPLTAPFTLETPQHVYALSATPPPRASLCFFSLATSLPALLFTVNLSFTQPPSIPKDKTDNLSRLFSTCSDVSLVSPPLSSPCENLPPPLSPCFTLTHLLLNLSSAEGPLGPQHYSGAALCKLVSVGPYQATQASTRTQTHTGQIHTTHLLEVLRPLSHCFCSQGWLCTHVDKEMQSWAFVLTWTRIENSVTKPLSSFRSWKGEKNK